jgi:hypothetical protein
MVYRKLKENPIFGKMLLSNNTLIMRKQERQAKKLSIMTSGLASVNRKPTKMAKNLALLINLLYPQERKIYLVKQFHQPRFVKSMLRLLLKVLLSVASFLTSLLLSILF